MKKMIFILIFSQSIFAQNSVRVTYETIRTFPESFFNNIPADQREAFKVNFSKPIYSQLTNNGEFSLHESINEKEILVQSNAIQTDNKINLGTKILKKNMWNLKDLKNNKIYIEVNVSEKKYYLENAIVNPVIVYTNKQIMIDKYKCKEAYVLSTKIPTDTIKYWIATDIPVNDAPVNELGFTGLVLKYKTKNAVQYATKIEFFDKKIVLPQLDKKIPLIDEDNYKKLRSDSLKTRTFIDAEGRENTIKSVQMSTDK